ncbi:hypothetical protein HK096_003970 [Nowakowskiella sp. JEL0078]|nr:hypothetical protein HK096_003970 [Nowakowskiella sp. JEL0078]
MIGLLFLPFFSLIFPATNPQVILQNINLNHPLKQWIELYVTRHNLISPNSNYTVVQKSFFPGNSFHDYFSLPPYWFPDNHGNWTRLDGLVNPAVASIPDKAMWGNLTLRIDELFVAYTTTAKTDYIDQIVRMVDLWFVNPDTRMNPHLRFAQYLAGFSESAELGRGLIDLRFLPLVVSPMLEVRRLQSNVVTQGFENWLGDYEEWLDADPGATHIAEDISNTAIWLALQRVAALVYLGRDDDARDKVIYAHNVYMKAIDHSTGLFPRESARVLSLHYNMFMCEAVLRLKLWATRVGVEFNVSTIQITLSMIARAVVEPRSWPFSMNSSVVFKPDVMGAVFGMASEVFNDCGYYDFAKRNLELGNRRWEFYAPVECVSLRLRFYDRLFSPYQAVRITNHVFVRFPYYIPFGLIAMFRWSFWFIRIFAYICYKPYSPKTVFKKRYSSNDVTIICPTIDTDFEFLEAVESWLANCPAKIIVVTTIEKFPILERLLSQKNIVNRPNGRLHLLTVSHANKREQMVEGLRHCATEIVVFADDDAFWPPTFIEWILAPFEARPDIGGVGSSQVMRPVGKIATMWERLAGMRLSLRMVEVAASCAIDHGVSCISGRSAAYLTHLLQSKEFMHEFTNEMWMGKYKLMSGDDKFLTRWTINSGYKPWIQICKQVEISSTFKDNWRFIKQLLRWTRNTWRSDFTSVFIDRTVWKRHTYVWLTMIDKFFNPIYLVYGTFTFIRLALQYDDCKDDSSSIYALEKSNMNTACKSNLILRETPLISSIGSHNSTSDRLANFSSSVSRLSLNKSLISTVGTKVTSPEILGISSEELKFSFPDKSIHSQLNSQKPIHSESEVSKVSHFIENSSSTVFKLPFVRGDSKNKVFPSTKENIESPSKSEPSSIHK